MSDDVELEFDDNPFGNLDMGGDDFESGQPNDDRNPVTQSVTTFTNRYTSDLLNSQQALAAARDALPEGFSRTLDVTDQFVDGGRRIYQDATKEIAGPMRDLAMATRRLTPRLRTLLPDSVVDNVDGWLDKFTESQDHKNPNPSKEEIDNQVILARTQDIFAKQLGVQTEQAQEQRVQKVIDDQVQTKRHNENRNIQSQLLQLASDEADYRNSVLWRYQKESLELSYRSFFAQRDLLENFKQFASMAQETLLNIQKNTALPEAQKVELSEQYREYAQEMLFGKAHEAMSNKLGNMGNRILQKLGVKVNEAAQGFAGFVGDISQLAEMQADQMDAEEEMGEGGINPLKMILEGQAGKLAKKTRAAAQKQLEKLMRDNPHLALWNEQALDVTQNLDQYLQMLKDGELSEEEPWWQRWMKKGLEWIEDDDIRDHETTVNNNLLQDATKPAHWDLLQRRSVTEIIPGYLARQLQQLEIIASGDPNVEMTHYSVQRESFNRETIVAADTADKVMGDDKIDALADSLKDFVTTIDKENRLTEQAQMVLANTVLSELRENRTFNEKKFAKRDTYGDVPDHLKDELVRFIQDEYRIDEYGDDFDYSTIAETKNEALRLQMEDKRKARQVRKSLAGVQSNFLNYQDGINLFHSTSDKELLRLAGFLKNTAKGDEFIKQNQAAATDRGLRRMLEKLRTEILNNANVEQGDLGPQPPPEIQGNLNQQNNQSWTSLFTGYDHTGAQDASNSPPPESSTSTAETTGSNNSMGNLGTVQFPSVYPLPESQLSRLIPESSGPQGNSTMGAAMARRDMVLQLIKIRENTDVLPTFSEAMSQTLGLGEPGLFKRGFTALASGLWGGAKAYGRGIANVGEFALDTAAGARNTVFSWFTRHGNNGGGNNANGGAGGAPSVEDTQDLYLANAWFPKLRAARLAAGEYFDKATGEVIRSWNDITGEVVDKDGNVLLSANEAAQEFITKQGSYVLKGVKAVALAPFKAAALYTDAVMQLPLTIMRGISGGWDRLSNRMNSRKDVYTKSGKVVLYYHRLRAGEYFDKESGKVIRSLEDIKGEVVDNEGNIVLSKADLDEGLVDRNGKPIRTFNLMNMVLGTASFATKFVTKSWDIAAKVTEDLYKGTKSGITGLWGKLMGKAENVSEGVVFKKVNVKDMHVKAQNVYINGTVFSADGPQGGPAGPTSDPEGSAPPRGTDYKERAEAVVESLTERGNAIKEDVTEKVSKAAEDVSDKAKDWLEEHTDYTREDIENLTREDIKAFLEKHQENAKTSLKEGTEEYRVSLEEFRKEFESGERTVASTAKDLKESITSRVDKLREEVVANRAPEVQGKIDDISKTISDIKETIYNQGTYEHEGETVNAFDQVSDRYQNSSLASRVDEANGMVRDITDRMTKKDKFSLRDVDNLDVDAIHDEMLLLLATVNANDDFLDKLSKESAERGDSQEEFNRHLVEAYKESVKAKQSGDEDQLNAINKVDTTLTEKLDKVVDAVVSLRSRNVFGDTDGDGRRQGSYLDIQDRYRAAKMKGEILDGRKYTRPDGTPKADAGSLGLLAGIGGMLGGIKDVLIGGFSALVGAKIGGSAGGVDVPAPVGGNPGNNSGGGKKGWGSKIWNGIKWAGKAAWGVAKWGLLMPAWWLAKGIVLGGAAVLGTTTALVVGATVGAAAGAYYGGNYLWRRSKPEPLELLRFAQYGFDEPEEQQLVAIRYLESELMDYVTYDGVGVASLNISDAEVFAEYADEFGLEQSQAHYLKWREWYLQRFVPVFTTNLTYCRVLSGGKNDARGTMTFGNLDLQDIDDEMDDEHKAEFIRKTVYKPETTRGGPLPYAIMACPFEPPVPMAGYAEVQAMADDLINRFEPSKEELAKREQAKAKLAEKALLATAGAAAIDAKKAEKIRQDTAVMVANAQKRKTSALNEAMNSDRAQAALMAMSGVSAVTAGKELENASVAGTTPKQQQQRILDDVESQATKHQTRMKENEVTVSAANDDVIETSDEHYILPVGGRLSSTFGHRIHPVRGTKHYHSGIDIAAPEGTPVVAAQSGKVVRRSYSKSYGNVVYINHPDGTQTRYAHLSGFAPTATLNSTIRQGELLGYVGSTGVSTGNHLHFQHKQGQLQSSKNINPLLAMGPKGAELHKKDLQLSREMFKPDLGEQPTDIDPAIEGSTTLAAGEKPPTSLTPAPVLTPPGERNSTVVPLPKAQSVADLSVAKDTSSDGGSVTLNNLETITREQSLVQNDVDVRPVAEEVSRLGTGMAAIVGTSERTNDLLEQLLKKDFKATVEQVASAETPTRTEDRVTRPNRQPTQTQPRAANNSVETKQIIPSVLNYS